MAVRQKSIAAPHETIGRSATFRFGLEPGRTIGASDKLGEHPITSPFTPLMVGTTIAELAGINAQARVEMNVLEGGQVIDELL